MNTHTHTLFRWQCACIKTSTPVMATFQHATHTGQRSSCAPWLHRRLRGWKVVRETYRQWQRGRQPQQQCWWRWKEWCGWARWVCFPCAKERSQLLPKANKDVKEMKMRMEVARWLAEAVAIVWHYRIRWVCCVYIDINMVWCPG